MVNNVYPVRMIGHGNMLRHGKLDVASPSCFAGCQFFGGNVVVKHSESLQDAEKTITEELYGMTMKERESVLHDIHGVADDMDEPPELVQSSQNDLEMALKQPRFFNSSGALQAAMSQSPEYVRSLYLKFLRSEEFHVQKTAQRMIRHFEIKRDLFGVGKLGRDITLDDLDTYDLDCLKAGFYQLLPQRDRAGRAIFMKTWYHQTCHVRENVWRAFWYINMVASLDEETQKKGMVALLYNVDPDWANTFDTDLFGGIGKLINALPTRYVASHYCFLDAAFGAIIKFISMTLDRKSRTRTRLHHGNHLEVQYDLVSFGIPMSALPVNSDGVMRVKEHLKWIQYRRKHEMLMKDSNGRVDVIIIPSRGDVLFGRGKTFQMHVGNMKLGSILEDRGTEYFDAKRNGKAIIAMDVVSHMKTKGTRFLRQDKDGLWIEVDDSTAADKVGHGFRNRKPEQSCSRQRKPKQPYIHKPTEKKPTGTTRQDSSSCWVKGVVAAKRFRFEDNK